VRETVANRSESYQNLRKLDYDTLVSIYRDVVKVTYVAKAGVKTMTKVAEIANDIQAMADKQEDPVRIGAHVLKLTIMPPQPFQDGNHSTAFQYLRIILRIFSQDIESPTDEKEKFLMTVRWISEDEINKWIKNHLIQV
jgi:hypothetical protein